ncbi:MAG: hypothetical protein Q9163_006029 [Psora crenata]
MASGDKIMGLDLPDGGHISHGFRTARGKVSETAHRFESIPYRVDLKSGLIDYDGLERVATTVRPRVIVAGASAYSRLINYDRMRQIANRCGALLVADMSHICGLVAAKVIPSPFHTCDVVTTTLYKTFQGPPGAMILFRKTFEERINRAVFPRFQAGPNLQQIVALAVALRHAQTPESKNMQSNILEGAKLLAAGLSKYGYELVGGGTDNHQVIVNLRRQGLGGAHVERVLELASVAGNRNMIPGDEAGSRSGIRLGSAAMITRGLKPLDFDRVADIVHRAIGITRSVMAEMATSETVKSTHGIELKRFQDQLMNGSNRQAITQLKNEVESWMRHYPPPWGQ